MKPFRKSDLFWKMLFFGSLWGIVEALLGHLLHFIPLPLSGIILFPIAYYLMRRASLSAGTSSIIPLMGLVAASIKLIGLTLPGLPPIKTLNPAMALIMESLTVYILYNLLERTEGRMPALIFMNISWRLLFVWAALLIDRDTSVHIPMVQSFQGIAIFIFLNGSISSLLCYPLHRLANRDKTALIENISLKPLAVLGSMAGALSLHYFL